MIITFFVLSFGTRAADLNRRQALATFGAAAVAPHLPKLAVDESVKQALSWRTRRLERSTLLLRLVRSDPKDFARYDERFAVAGHVDPDGLAEILRRLKRLEIDLALEFRQPLDQIWGAWELPFAARPDFAFFDNALAVPQTFRPTAAQFERMRAGLEGVSPRMAEVFGRLITRPGPPAEDWRVLFWRGFVVKHSPAPTRELTHLVDPMVDALLAFERRFARAHGLPESQLFEMTLYLDQPTLSDAAARDHRPRRFAALGAHVERQFLTEMRRLPAEGSRELADAWLGPSVSPLEPVVEAVVKEAKRRLNKFVESTLAPPKTLAPPEEPAAASSEAEAAPLALPAPTPGCVIDLTSPTLSPVEVEATIPRPDED